MKTSVTVRALQPFEWKGQSYRTGQSLDLTPIDAVVLAKKHHVTLTKRRVIVPEPPPAPEPELEKPKRGRYRRRDLQVEDTTELTVETPTESPRDAPSEPIADPAPES